jgi:hypothetical protein
MSWEDDDFEAAEADEPVAATGGAVAGGGPKKVSLETAAYEKQNERALEKKAALEADLEAVKSALEKAKAEAKPTAASKAYVASFEKKVAAAEAALAAQGKAIRDADVAEGKRLHLLKCQKKGIRQFDYERDYLGIVRRGKEVICLVTQF